MLATSIFSFPYNVFKKVCFCYAFTIWKRVNNGGVIYVALRELVSQESLLVYIGEAGKKKKSLETVGDFIGFDSVFQPCLKVLLTILHHGSPDHEGPCFEPSMGNRVGSI